MSALSVLCMPDWSLFIKIDPDDKPQTSYLSVWSMKGYEGLIQTGSMLCVHINIIFGYAVQHDYCIGYIFPLQQ